MADDYLTAARARAARRRTAGMSKAIIGVAGGAFLLGGAATGLVLWQTGAFDRAPATVAQPATEEVQQAAALPAPDPSQTATVQEVEEVARQTGGIDSRVAALEQRISRLDLQAEAAAGNAARAEGLLIAFAVRRALERGDSLGYLADQLRLRFGEAQPGAVATIIEFSRNPVRVEELSTALQGLEDELVTSPANEGFWSMLQRELGSLFVVRRESADSPQPLRRFERAQNALEEGRVNAAITEVRALPGSPMAGEWLADAQRYADMREALDRIESAAVLEPRNLRDGEGDRVEQPSPAETPA